MSAGLAEASDAELCRLALAQRQDAYRQLLQRYRQPVYRLVHASLGDGAEAQDVTQEVFVSAFAALDRYDPDRPLLHWLRRIALNKCRDWIRRRRVRAFFFTAPPLDEVLDMGDNAVATDVALADRAELARVAGAIARLPTRQREVLLLRTVEQLTQAEVSQLLGISEKAVETRLYRARQSLRERLAPESARG